MMKLADWGRYLGSFCLLILHSAERRALFNSSPSHPYLRTHTPHIWVDQMPQGEAVAFMTLIVFQDFITSLLMKQGSQWYEM
jgi:hypothetical protein